MSDSKEELQVVITPMYKKRKMSSDSEEPSQVKNCILCTEDDDKELHWLTFGKQECHVPCLLEIFKQEENPRNPFTNVDFTKDEVDEIEQRATQLKLFCPSGLFRRLLWQTQKRYKQSLSLATGLELKHVIPYIEQQMEVSKQDILKVAEQNPNMPNHTFLKYKTETLKELESFEIDIRHAIRASGVTLGNNGLDHLLEVAIRMALAANNEEVQIIFETV